MTALSCVNTHFDPKSPLAAYRAEMVGDVAELMAEGMDSDAAWLQVATAKISELKTERARIERVVADAYDQAQGLEKPAEKAPAAEPETAAQRRLKAEVADARRAEAEAALEQTAPVATHKDPGEPAEPVTPAVVREAIKPEAATPAATPPTLTPKAQAVKEALAGDRQPFEHAGLKVYPTKMRRDGAVVDVWAVQLPENKGTDKVMGDTLHPTLEGAKRAAEEEVQRYERDQRNRAELDAAEAKRKADEEARKSANRGKSILERRADAMLDKPIQDNGRQTSRRQILQSAVDAGQKFERRMVFDPAAKKRDEEAVANVRRRGYILGASNENIPVVKEGIEAQARLKTNKYEKPEYRMYLGRFLEGPFREITKTEYDYATRLTAQVSAAAPSAAPAAAPPVATREGQMHLANRASRIASLKMMNEHLRKIAPDEAWADSNIENAADLDALQDQISSALVAAQRGPVAENPLRAELDAMSGAELRAIMDRMGLAGARMTQAERVETLLAEDESEVRAAMAPEQAPAEQAAAILNAAAEPPKGAERLSVIKDVKAGAITPEEVAAAFPPAGEVADEAGNVSIVGKSDAAIARDALAQVKPAAEEVAALEAEYGATSGTTPFHERLAQDVADYITKGAEAIGAAIRGIVGKVAKVVLSIAVVFNVAGLNPQFSSESYARTVAAMPKTVTVTETVQFRQAGKADLNGRELSPAASKVVNWIGAQNRPSEVSLVLDPGTGRMYVLRGGKIEADAPALFGKQGVQAITDQALNASVDETTDDLKMTPAGRFPLTMQQDSDYGSRLDFLRSGASPYAIHRVYLGDPKERRQQRLDSATAGDNGVSFGCVNVSNEFYDKTLMRFNYNGDAYAYLIPSDPAQLDALVPMPEPLTTTRTSTYMDGGQQAGEQQRMGGDLGLVERRRQQATSARRRLIDGPGPQDDGDARMVVIEKSEDGAVKFNTRAEEPISLSKRVDAMKVGAQNAKDGQVDASPQAQRKVEELARAVRRALRLPDGAAAGGTNPVHPYEPRVAPGDAGLAQIAAAVGGRVQWFDLKGDLDPAQRRAYGFFDGANLGDTIYLKSTGVARPHLAILGHEFGHRLKAERPDLYEKLLDAITPYVNEGRYDMAFRHEAVAKDLKDEDKIQEEFVGEIFSDGFMDKGFWRAVGQSNPKLLAQIGRFIFKMINQIKAALGYRNVTTAYLKDFNRVMEIAGEIAGEFGQAIPASGEVKFNTAGVTTAQDLVDSKGGVKFSRAGGLASAVRQFKTVDQTKVRNALADLLGSAGTKVSWWDKYIGTQYAKAEKFPAYKRVFERVQSYIEDVSTLANEAADMAPQILPKLENLRDLKQSFKSYGLKGADAEAVAAPIFEGTLVDQRVYDDSELSGRFKLNTKQIADYRQFLAAVNVSLDQVVAADVLKLLGDKNPALRELALADRGAMRDGIDEYLTERADAAGEDATATDDDRGPNTKLRDDIRERYERIAKLKKEGYAPLMRFGKYKVWISDKETGESLFFGLYESKAEANRMAREFGQDPAFKGAEIEQGVLSEEQYKLFSAVPVESLEMFAEAVGADRSEVFQAYLRLAKNNRSALKRLIHRKGTAGFSEDVGRVLASFVTSNARLASGAMNLSAAKATIEDIRDGDIKDEAIKLVDSVQNPQETAAGVRALMFVNFIGGSIASAVVNLTQPVMMTLPYLSQFGGFSKAAGRLMDAAQMIASGKITDLAIAKAMKRAEDDGIVSPQEIHHLQAQAMGAWGSSALAKQASFIWGAPFSLAEQFNRRVSFVAAYKTAQEQGIEDPFAFAEKAVIESQGLYNKGNMPNLSRNPIGAAAMQFKQYSIHYLEWIKRMWNTGEPGSPERRSGRQAVLIALALLMMAAGDDGLPFADDIDDLIDTIGQAIGYDTNSKKARRNFVAQTLGMGDMAADVFARGLSALPGVPLDVSIRMGMGNLIPASGLMLRSNTDRSRDLLEVAGPAGGLARQYMDAGQKMLAGDFGGALAGATPMAAQNAIKAVGMWSTGEARDMKGNKVMEADQVDGLMKFLGFNPQDIARESQKLNMIRRSEQFAKNVEGEIASAWARAMADGDSEGVKAARQELADWNEANPESRIAITSAQIIQRVRKMRQSREQRFITSTSPERREAVKEAMQ